MPCKDPVKRAAYQAKWQRENKEKKRGYGKKYRAANVEKERVRHAKFYEDNKENVMKYRATTTKDRREYQVEYRKKNREILRARQRSYTFGLSDFDYNRMSDEQGFSCAICKGGLDDPTTHQRETLHIDHCHRTNKNRGLLCAHCNHGLGKFKDSIGLLRAAAQYLLDRG